jgi:hypothetical protein
MIRLLMRVTLAAVTAGVISAAQAQIPAAPVALLQSPPAAYSGSAYQSHLFAAPTAEAAYRDGLVNRWELEQIAGPLPQALQGPSVDGTRGGDGGGGGRD